MNGTRGWGTLVDVPPEGQAEVRQSGVTASLPPQLGTFRFQFLGSGAPRLVR